MRLIDTILNGAVPAQMQDVLALIVAESQANDIDPVYMCSIALMESALNPNCVGDNGTSYGLFQLNIHGELKNLTPEQALNPVNNIEAALVYIKHFYKPGLSVGDNAVLAQRPKYKAFYSTTINYIYPLMKSLLKRLNIYGQ